MYDLLESTRVNSCQKTYSLKPTFNHIATVFNLIAKLSPKLYSKTATRYVLWKKLFLKISQYSQKKPVLESLFNKVTGLQACNFTKGRLQHRCFLVNIAKFWRTAILKNICERLLLYTVNILDGLIMYFIVPW